MKAVDRLYALQLYHDIQTARRIMMSVNNKERKREKTEAFQETLDGLRQRYKAMKREQRFVPLWNKQQHVIRTRAAIETALTTLCKDYKFTEKVTIGGPHRVGSVTSFGKAITFHVGFMWFHDIWEKIHKDSRMVTKGYVVLTATEFRTNVPHIRLYKATAYSDWKKKVVSGWVGQSKLGKQRCAFVTSDEKIAITTALKLAAGAVDEQIKGETK